MKRLLTVLLACAFVTVFDCEVVLAQKKVPDFSAYEVKKQPDFSSIEVKEDWTKKYQHLRAPMKARKLMFSYVHSTGDEERLENDYRLFGIVKDAMENTWKRRPLKIEIKNGLIFNSRSTTSGEMGGAEFELDIFIKTRLRDGKMVYAYHTECT